MHRQIAGKLTGPVTKWIVLFVGASGFAQKLTEVQDNESASWLPGDAESTLALDRLEVFQNPEDLPTTVVHHRDWWTDLVAQPAGLGKLEAPVGLLNRVSR